MNYMAWYWWEYSLLKVKQIFVICFMYNVVTPFEKNFNACKFLFSTHFDSVWVSYKYFKTFFCNRCENQKKNTKSKYISSHEILFYSILLQKNLILYQNEYTIRFCLSTEMEDKVSLFISNWNVSVVCRSSRYYYCIVVNLSYSLKQPWQKGFLCLGHVWVQHVFILWNKTDLIKTYSLYMVYRSSSLSYLPEQ